MTEFELNGRYTKCASARIVVGKYPGTLPDGGPFFGWQVVGDCGGGYEVPITQPTVNLVEEDEFPAEGHVFIRVTPEYEGCLESLQAAGIVGEPVRELAAGFVDRYAVEVPVLNGELREQHGWSRIGPENSYGADDPTNGITRAQIESAGDE